MSDNPYRIPGATVLPAKVVEVPSTTDKRHLLDAVAMNNGTTIDPAMHEQRYLQILGEMIDGMDLIIKKTSLGQKDFFHFTVPYLRSELVDGKIECNQCRDEWDELDRRLAAAFETKGWSLYISLFNHVFQPIDIAFWKKSRMVTLATIITLKPI